MKYDFKNPATVKGTVKDKIRRVVSTRTEINRVRLAHISLASTVTHLFYRGSRNRHQWKTFKESLKKSYLINVISEESP